MKLKSLCEMATTTGCIAMGPILPLNIKTRKKKKKNGTG